MKSALPGKYGYPVSLSQLLGIGYDEYRILLVSVFFLKRFFKRRIREAPVNTPSVFEYIEKGERKFMIEIHQSI